MNTLTRINHPEHDGFEDIGSLVSNIAKDAIMRAYAQGVFDADEAMDLIVFMGLKSA